MSVETRMSSASGESLLANGLLWLGSAWQEDMARSRGREPWSQGVKYPPEIYLGVKSMVF